MYERLKIYREYKRFFCDFDIECSNLSEEIILNPTHCHKLASRTIHFITVWTKSLVVEYPGYFVYVLPKQLFHNVWSYSTKEETSILNVIANNNIPIIIHHQAMKFFGIAGSCTRHVTTLKLITSYYLAERMESLGIYCSSNVLE